VPMGPEKLAHLDFSEVTFRNSNDVIETDV
jgi:hypothetical protein